MRAAMIWLILLLPWFHAGEAVTPETGAKARGLTPFFRGMTISCQGWGAEWADAGFADELRTLQGLGVNAVATHPYARIHADGSIRWRSWRANRVPDYVLHPLRTTQRAGLHKMVKPHLAYWGSPFSWRGDITFADPAAQRRFFDDYQKWIVALARDTSSADLFVVGTELDRMVHHEAEWRRIIAAVRAVTDAPLTFASNWDSYHKVPFWDALDYVGIQAYFPLTQNPTPDSAAIRAGWQAVMGNLKTYHRKVGKPILFTELGYNRSRLAAAQPWDYKRDSSNEAAALQAQCLRIGLQVLAENADWCHGAFLWKWFVGDAAYENFYLKEPRLTAEIRRVWLTKTLR
ncbi:glycoside hydrolase family 113 [Acanthopleuribacter pedis]|uniref:GTA TIM-barrel-like domain-containing protein n=1 Tax=Acanthopleuribacter pedis TaxID=442870 RepID=A0A8J7QJV7_9BACT|nr:hypothetical protein [Acanthopleuribacter pedis]MBO1322241.1 hypothetical protein [Acanthopleuribacter pedis]